MTGSLVWTPLTVVTLEQLPLVCGSSRSCHTSALQSQTKPTIEGLPKSSHAVV